MSITIPTEAIAAIAQEVALPGHIATAALEPWFESSDEAVAVRWTSPLGGTRECWFDPIIFEHPREQWEPLVRHTIEALVDSFPSWRKALR